VSAPLSRAGPCGPKDKLGRMDGFEPNSGIPLSFYVFSFSHLFFILNPKFEIETLYEFHL
jgi:hypothetical protein